MIDKHTIALISIIGCSLDLMGAMYLAYDLLGGEHGPVLRQNVILNDCIDFLASGLTLLA